MYQYICTTQLELMLTMTQKSKKALEFRIENKWRGRNYTSRTSVLLANASSAEAKQSVSSLLRLESQGPGLVVVPFYLSKTERDAVRGKNTESRRCPTPENTMRGGDATKKRWAAREKKKCARRGAKKGWVLGLCFACAFSRILREPGIHRADALIYIRSANVSPTLRLGAGAGDSG